MKKVFILIIAIIVIAFLSLESYISFQYEKPNDNIKEQVLLIEKGNSINSISNKLFSEKKDKFLFSKIAQFKNKDTEIKTGEFLIPAKSNFKEILNIISSNNTIDHKITIVEGYQKYQIPSIFDNIENLTGDISAITQEGIYMPDTYLYKYGDTKISILNRAKKSMNEYLDNAWQNRDKNLPIKTKEEALILASIIEKETSQKDEYKLISSVFINRINKGMKLQADSTSIYGITNGEKKFDRKLYKKDLEKINKYNTYIIKGLPVAPICNPGRKAIDAVMHPADTKYLYFVADGTGGHVFAKTGKEHEHNVVKWRKIKNNF